MRQHDSQCEIAQETMSGPYSRLASWVIVAMLGTGCSAAYNNERLYWKAERLTSSIAQNPSRATPAQFARAIEAFRGVATRAIGTEWAARAHLAIGALYTMQQRDREALEQYTLVLEQYDQYTSSCLDARMAIGRIYERQQRWDDAVRVYQELAMRHTWSPEGGKAPLYIAQLYDQLQRSAEAKTAYARAIELYKEWRLNAPSPESATQLNGYLASAYQRLGQWSEVRDTLEELLRAPSGVNRPATLFALGNVYQERLHDPVRAEAAYHALRAEFPDHLLAKESAKWLERLTRTAIPMGDVVVSAAQYSASPDPSEPASSP